MWFSTPIGNISVNIHAWVGVAVFSFEMYDKVLFRSVQFLINKIHSFSKPISVGIH